MEIYETLEALKKKALADKDLEGKNFWLQEKR